MAVTVASSVIGTATNAGLYTLNSPTVIPLSNVVTLTPSALGSATATVSSATGIFIGAYVYSTAYPANTVVDGISGTTLTLSQVSTSATADAAARFGNSMNMLAPQSITLANGNTSITGATTVTWKDGCFIAGKGIPDGTRIQNLNGVWTLTNAYTGVSGSVQVCVQAKNDTGGENGWLVGGTLNGAGGNLNGARVVSVIPNKQVTMNRSYTGATGLNTSGFINTMLSSTTVALTLSASGDTATPLTFINNGFGTLLGARTILLPGRITLNIATGAVYDDSEWTYELSFGGSLQLNETYGCGTWRSGYILQGATYIKAKGHTVNYSNFRGSNNAGGASIFFNTGAPVGYPGAKPVVQWNDCAWIENSGANAAATLTATYTSYSCGRIVMDYQNDSGGANAGIQGSFGSIESLFLYKCIGGVTPGADNTQVVSIGKFEYFSLPTGGGGSNPDIKMAFPNNIPFSGFAPIFYLVPPTNEFLGCNTANNEILVDYILPTGFDVLTNSRNFNFGSRTYRRTVSFPINDSNGASLAGATVYIVSGSNTLVNAVQAGNFSQALNAVTMSWAGRVASGYIAPITSTDTRSQTAQFRRYGYVQQKVSYSLQDAAYTQPIFLLSETTLAGISEATAAALTKIAIDWTTKTITTTASSTYDEINARIAYELALTANSPQLDPRTISGKNLTLASGWSLIVNTGVTISDGAEIKFLSVPTVTIQGTGKIVGVYGTSVGVSTTLELRNVSPGASYIVANSTTKATILYGTNGTGTAQTYTLYFPPGSTGTSVFVAREKYGSARISEVLTLLDGLMWYTFVDETDIGISNTDLAQVQAYTAIENPDKLYDRIAAFRLTEIGIKIGQIATRDGLSLRLTGFDLVVDKNAPSAFSVDQVVANPLFSSTGVLLADGVLRDETILGSGGGNIIKIKSTSFVNGIKYTNTVLDTTTELRAASNEVIGANFEDKNGDSALTIVGGDGVFELWKVTTATATADYQTGIKLTTPTIGNIKYRFAGVTGFDIVGVDINSGVRRRTSMLKGFYTQSFYVGDQIQLANVAAVDQINAKVDVMQVDLSAIKGAGFVSADDSLHALSLDLELIKGTGFVSSIDSLHAIKNTLNDTPTQTTAGVWSAAERSLTDKTGFELTQAQITEITSAAGGASLAEIEASTVLAKASQITALGTPLQAADYVAAPTAVQNATAVRTELSTELARLDVAVSTRSTLTAQDIPAGLTAAQVWGYAQRALTDKDGFNLSQVQVDALATEIESRLLDENDGQKLLEAIVNAIGNTNIDQIALVAAIRADLERPTGTLATRAAAGDATATLAALGEIKGADFATDKHSLVKLRKHVTNMSQA